MESKSLSKCVSAAALVALHNLKEKSTRSPPTLSLKNTPAASSHCSDLAHARMSQDTLKFLWYAQELSTECLIQALVS